MNTSAITPYRSAAVLPTTKAIKSGFLRATTNNPLTHHCPLPGYWYSVWRWLTFRPIRAFDFFRCGQCGKIHQTSGYSNDPRPRVVFLGHLHDWRSQNSQDTLRIKWLEAGGALDDPK